MGLSKIQILQKIPNAALVVVDLCEHGQERCVDFLRLGSEVDGIQTGMDQACLIVIRPQA